MKTTEERLLRLRRLEAAFLVHHAENPHVYVLFDKFTWQVIRAGFNRYSARAIFHRIRWYTNIETSDPTFKLNNNHSPYYARMWMEDHPEFPEFFETRQLRTGIVEIEAEIECQQKPTSNGQSSASSSSKAASPAASRINLPWARSICSSSPPSTPSTPKLSSLKVSRRSRPRWPRDTRSELVNEVGNPYQPRAHHRAQGQACRLRPAGRTLGRALHDRLARHEPDRITSTPPSWPSSRRSGSA